MVLWVGGQKILKLSTGLLFPTSKQAECSDTFTEVLGSQIDIAFPLPHPWSHRLPPCLL